MKPNSRFITLFVVLGLAAAGLLVYYGKLMLRKAPPEQPTQGVKFSERGTILDRNGRALAIQIKLSNIGVWKPNVTDVRALATTLAPILEMPSTEIIDKINKSESDFLYIKKKVDDSATRLIYQLRKDEKIPGVTIEPIVGRIYPDGTLASQTIGFCGYENEGLSGIEYAFEEELSGINNDGKGSHVVLTIDSNVQYILEQKAEKIMQESKAEAVMFLAMDPRSGDILGCASLPNFDPNDFSSYSDVQRMDRAALWPYEPGSVFKVFTISAMMESGAISDSSRFTCNGAYERVNSRGILSKISCMGTHGSVGPRQIIIYSCNAGAAYASDRLNNEAFNELIRNYGFGERTAAGNPAESRGHIWPLSSWSDRSKPTIAMGQELSVTALQMIQAASAVANDGEMVHPRIVSQIISSDGKRSEAWNPGPRRQVLKAETARAMRSYMVDVTSGIGTGSRAWVEDLSLAVKTGTAQMNDPKTREYSRTDFIASCIALLPAESPSLILYLAIVKPRGEILGGRIAAPPIREAAEDLADYLGIPRGRNPQASHPAKISLPLDRPIELGDTVPAFTGLPKRAILPLLLRQDINVEVYGEGWVVRQSPPPGTPVTENMTIILEFE